MGTLHCALENGADLYVNERQKIRHYRARSTEERRRKKSAKLRIFLLRALRTPYSTHSIGNQPQNTFKMSDSVPSARYSSVCNVLRQSGIWLIPTYRVYPLYDTYNYSHIFFIIMQTFFI